MLPTLSSCLLSLADSLLGLFDGGGVLPLGLGDGSSSVDFFEPPHPILLRPPWRKHCHVTDYCAVVKC